MQSSMGPTQTMIDAQKSAFETDAQAAAKEWLQAQIALPFTSHREYFRKRINPRANDETASYASINNPCSVGSRWHNFAFTFSDTGKTMVLSKSASDLHVITIDGVRRSEAPISQVLSDLKVDSCTTSSAHRHWSCMKAFDGTWQRFEFSRNPLDNTMGGMGQWIKATFAEEVTISRFAWLNRGGNRDIKDVTFQFSDESTQTATLLKRTNDKPGCLNVNFAGSGSCAMSFTTPVKTTSVKVTVDSVYPWFDTYWGRYYDGVNHKLGYMGAYNIKFWGTAPSKVEALKDQPDGFKICSVAEGDGGEIKFGHECKGMMLNPLVNFENVGSNNVQEFGGDAAVFAELGNEPGVRILSSMSTVCTLTGSEAYLRLATDPAGVYYKHDPTLEFVDNVLENPKPVPKGWDKARRRRVRWETPKKGCVTVPKTYQNKDTCYLQPSCRDEDQSGAGLVTGGAGGWGGTCECPDGQQFEVGDNWDACRSLACEGGKMLNCNRHWNSKWAGRRVNCNRKGGVQMEVCGSLGEVANDAATGRIIALQAGGPKDGRWGRKNKQDLFRYFNSRSTKHMVWLNIALDAPDTFRQRAAWALSQIWTCAGGTESSSDSTEHWAQYYDIFVRNTFGNVRNILKEVTYSPVMMLYLTYRGNKGFAKTGVFPDENM